MTIQDTSNESSAETNAKTNGQSNGDNVDHEASCLENALNSSSWLNKFKPTESNTRNGDAKTAGIPDDWTDQLNPKNKGVWQGFGGMSIMFFGTVLPLLMNVLVLYSIPKRTTLVLLNHPIETIAEMLLVLSIPIANYTLWSAICKNNLRYSIKKGIAMGVAIATSLLISAIALAGIFLGGNTLESEIGSNFATGFSALVFLFLIAGAVSLYLVNRIRLARDFAKSRSQVVTFTLIGVLLAIATFLGAEARPWCIRLAEMQAMSDLPKEHKEGLERLRLLRPERELTMECSDSRAAGLSGLFLPDVKSTNQRELFFELTGKPFSFKDITNTDVSAMPDEFVTQHVVGEKIEGLSMRRSKLTGVVHPNTLSSTLDWTFVFRNLSSSEQEARTEIGLPPGAVISGLNLKTNGEPQEATFAASGKAQTNDQRWSQAGHDSPAIVTDLGHGRMLLHCYPVHPGKQLEVRLSIVTPLTPIDATTASVALPKFIATNFDLSGENAIRLRSSYKLTMNDLKSDSESGYQSISGDLSEEQLKNSNLVITAARPVTSQPVAVLDKLAVQIHQEDEEKRLAASERIRKTRRNSYEPQILVTVDGSAKGVQHQLEEIDRALAPKTYYQSKDKPKVKVVQARYVIENVKRVASPAPKKLYVVVDGSATMNEFRTVVADALGDLPATVKTSIIVASQEQASGPKPMEVSAGQNLLRKTQFTGGQDNLEAVIKATELAGEAKGGSVLWIHGPQPTLNEEIYIMPQFAEAPKFYELPLGNGDTDTFDFFKNHKEVGPFFQVPRNTVSVANDLGAFFSRWNPDKKGFAVVLSETSTKPANCAIASNDEARELLALHANQEIKHLTANTHLRRAAKIAVRYGVVTPVSCALINRNIKLADDTTDDTDDSNFEIVAQNKEGSSYLSYGGTGKTQIVIQGAPTLQGASNGTIGPQGTDATYVTGVNTAGTVRVNNLANLEALLNIVANLFEIGGLVAGVVIAIHALGNKQLVLGIFGRSLKLAPTARMAIGIGLVLLGLAFPGMINWFVASARDANLFS